MRSVFARIVEGVIDVMANMIIPNFKK